MAAARPQLLTGAEAASPAKLKRLAKRDERVWRHADGYVTITEGLKSELVSRFGPRKRIALVPDGVRTASVQAPNPKPQAPSPKPQSSAKKATTGR